MQNANGSNDREFMGITQNECTFQGKVIGDPIIHGDNYAYLTLRTSVSELGSNGQWADVMIDVPFITMDTSKVSTINSYIKDGRKLLIYAYYKAWVQNGQPQHAFIIKKIVFGPKKWEPKADVSTPGLPVS